MSHASKEAFDGKEVDGKEVDGQEVDKEEVLGQEEALAEDIPMLDEEGTWSLPPRDSGPSLYVGSGAGTGSPPVFALKRGPRRRGRP